MRPEHAAVAIEVRIRHLDQLFNVIDPAPFRERALDPDAAEFIVDAAEEIDRRAPLAITVHLTAGAAGSDVEHVPEAIRNFFAWRADRAAHELRQLRAFGRRSLVVGLGFMALCLVAAGFLGRTWPTAPTTTLLQEGLTILGWVSLWRPLEILLYEWWPLGRRERLYRRLAEATVEVRTG